jgi:membrane-bound lytic murein transglycosylase B
VCAAAAVPVAIVAVIAVWIIRAWASPVQPMVMTVTSAGPQPVAAGTGAGAASVVPARKGAAASSSPLDRVDHAWAARAAAATGIPGRAFLAYASADLTIVTEQPACGLGWNTLAAIGTVESANGTFGGATLFASGYTSKPIIGVPLNGGKFAGGTVAAIPDTDHGKLDGDTRWDRAVGPFQFLPATWARWGADGNGDGVASPAQIDDAALAAARYLCASGTMTSATRWRAAVFTYNQSNDYVNEVAQIANRYAAGVS